MPRPRSSLPTSLPCLLLAALLGACDTPPPPPPRSAPRPLASAPAPASASASTSASLPEAPIYPQPAPPDPPIVLAAGGKNAVRGEAGLVTSVEPNATRAGAEVLRRGGNAIDAAVAVAFALAVTHPSAGNIGGGGFMLVRTREGETTAIDFREAAPAAATWAKNKAMLEAGAIGYASAGVPGTVAGLALAHERFGTKPFAELVAPAIALAQKGHRLGARQGLTIAWAWDKLRKDRAARAIFGRGKKPLSEGDRIRQPDLAKTLELIAREGPRAFYQGAVAKKIDEAMRAHGGLVTAADLAAYRARIREPLAFSYRGFQVSTMPPPSMGGVAFAEIMLSLERWRAFEAPLDSGLFLHLYVEAARRAYAERRLVGADPDFVDAAVTRDLVTKLLSGEHLATRTPLLDRAHATPSSALGDSTTDAAIESPETTHFSVVDAEGNAVACTYTLSAGFGSKIVIPGTGIVLGNAMGGFSESGVNELRPGKRMASSMTPTIVTQKGKLVLVLGSPGGDTIPNTVAQVFRNLVDHGMTIDEAILHGRVHHQYLPDKIRVEKKNPPPREALAELAKRGHAIDMNPMPIGDANDILVDAASGVAWGFADLREGGLAIGLDKGDEKRSP